MLIDRMKELEVWKSVSELHSLVLAKLELKQRSPYTPGQRQGRLAVCLKCLAGIA